MAGPRTPWVFGNAVVKKCMITSYLVKAYCLFTIVSHSDTIKLSLIVNRISIDPQVLMDII